MANFKLINLAKLAFDKLKFAAIESWINDTVSYQTPVILTDAANVDWDPTKNYNAQVTLAGNRTLRFPAIPAGSYGTIKIIQGGTGSYTLTLPAQYTNKVANAGAGALTLTATVGAIDVASFYYDGIYIHWTYSNNFT